MQRLFIDLHIYLLTAQDLLVVRFIVLLVVSERRLGNDDIV